MALKKATDRTPTGHLSKTEHSRDDHQKTHKKKKKEKKVTKEAPPRHLSRTEHSKEMHLRKPTRKRTN